MFVIKTVETTKSYDDREKRFVVKRCFNIVVECYKYVIHRFIPPEKMKFSPPVFYELILKRCIFGEPSSSIIFLRIRIVMIGISTLNLFHQTILNRGRWIMLEKDWWVFYMLFIFTLNYVCRRKLSHFWSISFTFVDIISRLWLLYWILSRFDA